MNAVYKKELKSYFSTMTGYIAIAMLLAMTGFFVKLSSLDGHYPDMAVALPAVAIMLLLAIPIITMRSFAEERRQKTDQLLYSLPITTTQMVMGKYLAMLTVFAVPVAIMGLYPLILSMYGTVNFVASYTSLMTFFFMIAAMVAVCMFMSSLTESQIIAAVLGSGVLILFYFVQLFASALPATAVASFLALAVLVLLIALVVFCFVKNYWIAFCVAAVLEVVLLIFYVRDSSLFAGLFQKMLGKLAIFDVFNNAVNSQLFDLTAVVYYLSFSAFFTFLTIQTVEKKRYA